MKKRPEASRRLSRWPANGQRRFLVRLRMRSCACIASRLRLLSLTASMRMLLMSTQRWLRAVLRLPIPKSVLPRSIASGRRPKRAKAIMKRLSLFTSVCAALGMMKPWPSSRLSCCIWPGWPILKLSTAIAKRWLLPIGWVSACPNAPRLMKASCV